MTCQKRRGTAICLVIGSIVARKGDIRLKNQPSGASLKGAPAFSFGGSSQ